MNIKPTNPTNPLTTNAIMRRKINKKIIDHHLVVDNEQCCLHPFGGLLLLLFMDRVVKQFRRVLTEPYTDYSRAEVACITLWRAVPDPRYTMLEFRFRISQESDVVALYYYFKDDMRAERPYPHEHWNWKSYDSWIGSGDDLMKLITD